MQTTIVPVVMPELVYSLCMLVGGACTVLLFKSYFRSRARVLLWVGLAFALLTVNNIFVCIDLIALPQIDMGGPIVRNALSALAGTVLVFGLAWEVT